MRRRRPRSPRARRGRGSGACTTWWCQRRELARPAGSRGEEGPQRADEDDGGSGQLEAEVTTGRRRPWAGARVARARGAGPCGVVRGVWRLMATERWWWLWVGRAQGAAWGGGPCVVGARARANRGVQPRVAHDRRPERTVREGCPWEVHTWGTGWHVWHWPASRGRQPGSTTWRVVWRRARCAGKEKRTLCWKGTRLGLQCGAHWKDWEQNLLFI